MKSTLHSVLTQKKREYKTTEQLPYEMGVLVGSSVAKKLDDFGIDLAPRTHCVNMGTTAHALSLMEEM